jgi:hypothetical protein
MDEIDFNCPACNLPLRASRQWGAVTCAHCNTVISLFTDSHAALRRVQRCLWHLQTVRIRQTARSAFDLTQFGHGSPERLCSALILGAVFFFATLLICVLCNLPPHYVILLSSVALVSVMAASAILILGKTDVELDEATPKLKLELAALHDRIAVLKRQEALQWENELRAQLEEEAREEAAEAARIAEEERRAKEYAARPRPCPFCKEIIHGQALKCKHCGELLDRELRYDRDRLRFRQQQRWNPGVAAVLSFFWPGLGQMYKGQVLNGFVWMFFVLVGYVFCLVPGFILHVFCVFGAASGSD